MRTKVLFISTSDPEYSRVKLTREALREYFSVEVIESKASSYPIRFSVVILKMLLHKILGRKQDVIYVGFMAQPIFPVVKLLWPKKKVVVDFFFSLFDTLCLDKRLAKPDSIQGKLTYLLDSFAINNSSLIVSDTKAHAQFYEDEFFNGNHFINQTVYIGADEKVFMPIQFPKIDKVLKVEFHGYFIPLQGVKTIVNAAKLLQDQNIPVEFTIIGNGQTYDANVNLARKYGLVNVNFVGKKNLEEVAGILQQSHVGLGIFGISSKSKRVIPNKAYEVLASKRLLITEDSKASREILAHKKSALLVPPGNAKALSDMIMYALKNPHVVDEIAETGYQTFKKKADKRYQSLQVKNSVEKVL